MIFKNLILIFKLMFEYLMYQYLLDVFENN